MNTSLDDLHVIDAGTGRVLTRTAFVTSRAMDFFSQKELTAQTGHEVNDWPLVVFKELVDNALDACEEAGIAPVIHVTVDNRGITIADNGPGIPESVILGVVDFKVRVSSREAYIAPDRGKQGNALMTIIAMPFVLNGELGSVEIVTGGTAHTIEMKLDRIRQQPLVQIDDKPSDVKIGTSIHVEWPDSASQLLANAKSRFLQIAENYAWLNPHLSIHIDWFGQRMVDITARETGWAKWKPRDPTSPHWYRPTDLARLVGAYIDHDARAGLSRTVREFIGEFRGLSGSAKQKAVASAARLTGASLGDLALQDGQLDTPKVGKLLEAMQAWSKPVKPQALGILGQDHLHRCFADAGAEMGTFVYRKIEGNAKGIPWVVEAAFAAHATAFEGSEGKPVGQRLVCGVNWSPALTIPFHNLGHYGLESLLTDQHADGYAVMIAVHLACPRIEYLDRGKSSIALPSAEVGNAIVNVVTKVTAAWAKQRKAEERSASAASRRRERLARPSRSVTQVDAAFSVMEAAYLRASANGTLPALARQIMYQARGPMQELTGKTLGGGFDQYFCQTLLPRYMTENPERTGDWDVVFDARGHFTEPHTRRMVPLGTIAVRDYLAQTEETITHSPGNEMIDVGHFPTCGPRHRYQAILFIEKEGFTPLFEAVRLAERYDIAIMSTKGVSVTSSRLLVDRLCAKYGIPLLVLHDFDKAGFTIAGTLRRSTRRYKFVNADISVVDLGLRLDDVTSCGLETEDVCYGKTDPTANLVENGATQGEVDFLHHGHDPLHGGHWGQRVELNAFTSDAFIKWVEAKLGEHRIAKVIPDAKFLNQAYQRAAEAQYINLHNRQVVEDARLYASGLVVRTDLRRQVERRLLAAPEMSWDQAVGQIAAGGDV
jgi:DNA topoisomerase VI subunit B